MLAHMGFYAPIQHQVVNAFMLHVQTQSDVGENIGIIVDICYKTASS